MDYFDSKVLESFMISEDSIATEGVIGKAALGIGSILAGYALLILGISASIKLDKSNKKKDYQKQTGIKSDPEIIKNVADKCIKISNDALNDIKKLLQNKKYLDTLRKSIADKLKIDISKVPKNFKSHIVDYEPDTLVVMIDYDIISDLYVEAKKSNELDFDEEEFGNWINLTIRPSLENIIAKLRKDYYGPEIVQRFIEFDTTDHWQEFGIYVSNRY